MSYTIPMFSKPSYRCRQCGGFFRGGHFCVGHERKVSPQPWKLEVPRPLDMEVEMNPREDITTQYHITEPDDFMEDRCFEDRPTGKWAKPARGKRHE